MNSPPPRVALLFRKSQFSISGAPFCTNIPPPSSHVLETSRQLRIDGLDPTTTMPPPKVPEAFVMVKPSKTVAAPCVFPMTTPRLFGDASMIVSSGPRFETNWT